ncbi:MAG: UbiD family decarboxylase [Burkholderiales bacterium]|jgi:2,5-furandicarboxylate decarboxylase 1|nr:UbiD family decarboxylase [Burkholderiales bacterium]
MTYRDLRAFLDALGDDVRRVDAPFDPRHEIAAALREARAEAPALLFENVAGHPGWRVVGNLIANRRRLARAFETAEAELAETYLQRKQRGIDPVDARDAPCKDVIVTEGDDLIGAVPILTHHERDAGPFITTGVVLCKDPATGRRGMGVHRMMVHAGRRLGILLANPPLSLFHAAAESRGEPLEIAVALGLEPALVVASVVKVGPLVPDKMAIAGALRGAPVEMVRGETVGVQVPARAEVVIEGRVLPNVRQREGPFGENTGAYFSNESPVVEVTAVTHRRQPIYPGLTPWSADVDMLLWLAAGTEMLGQLRAHVSGVADLELMGGTAGFSMVIATSGTSRTEVRRLIHLALAMDKRLKTVTVVDDDVDIRSPREIAWAMATRHRPAQDTIVIEGTEAYVIDPSASGAAQASKIGFDATRGGGGAAFDKARLSAAAVAKARAHLADLMP